MICKPIGVSSGRSFVSALGVLLQKPWARALTNVRDWREPEWRPRAGDRDHELLADLLLRGPVPYSKFELADVPALPAVGIDWQILPRAQGKYPRAGYVRLRLPFSSEPQELLEATDTVVQNLPVQQGRAGYLCHVDERARRIGFDQAWLWARRYDGIDIVDTVEETWDATRALLGVNWLTILGERWLAGPLKDVALDSSDRVSATSTRYGGVILQAGSSPTIGDQNRFQDVSAYSAASILIKPALLETPTGLPGRFDYRKSTGAWIHRFIDPQAWREST